MPKRRIVIVRVNTEVMEHMLFTALPGVWHRTDFGLPAGAKCLGRYYDAVYDQFLFQFEHESFAEVEDSQKLPEFTNFGLSAFCFEAPIDAKQVAEMERLIAKQVERYNESESAPSAVVG